MLKTVKPDKKGTATAERSAFACDAFYSLRNNFDI